MLNELTEKEILDYLMSSDFNEGLTPDEFKLLLIKFRNFYRVLYSKCENFKEDSDFKSKKIQEIVDDHIKKIDQLSTEKANIENQLHFTQNKNLSWKERF